MVKLLENGDFMPDERQRIVSLCWLEIRGLGSSLVVHIQAAETWYDFTVIRTLSSTSSVAGATPAHSSSRCNATTSASADGSP